MKLIVKYTIQNIKTNKIIGLIIMFSLIISSSVLYMTLVSRDEVIARYEALNKKAFQEYNLILTKRDSTDPFFEKKSIKMTEQERKSGLEMLVFYGKLNKADTTTNISFTSVNLSQFYEKKLLEVSTENDFSSYGISGKNKVIISPSLAEKFKLKAGDNFKINTDVGEIDFEVGAIAKETGLFTGQENENRIIMDIKNGEKILGLQGKINALLVSESKDTDLGKAIKRIESENWKGSISAATLIDYETMEYNLNLISQVLIIILVLSVFINMYVISSNAKRVLTSRIPVIGTFRSLGCSKKVIHGIILLENLIYAVLGGGIGVALAAGFKDTIINMFVAQGTESLGYDTSAVVPLYVLIAISFALIIQVLSVYKILHETTKKTVKNLIIESPNIMNKKPRWNVAIWVLMLVASVVVYTLNDKDILLITLVIALMAMISIFKLLPYISSFVAWILVKIGKKINHPLFTFSVNNIKTSNTLNDSVKLVSTASCIILMIFITSISFQSLFTQANKSFTADYQLYGMTKSISEYDTLKKVKNVDELKALYTYNVDITIDDTVHDMILCGMNKQDYGIENVYGDIASLGEKEIMIDAEYAYKYDLKIGDIIIIPVEEGSKETKEYVITGTINAQCFAISRNIMVISDKNFKANFTDVPATLYISVKSGNTDIKSQVYKKITGEEITIQSYDEFIEQQELQVSGLLSMVWVILILSIILSIIGLVNNQTISFVQRKRELAVLYSVAMNKSQLKMMVVVEMVCTFAIACTSGLVWGVYMSKLLEMVLAGLGMYLDVSIPWGTISLLQAGVFLSLLLTNIIPIMQLNKMNVVKEIRYE